MKETIIECRSFAARADLHKGIAAALSFPEWYGNNLDALHDQLTAIGEQTVIRLSHWAEAEAAMGRYSLCARRAMEDAQKRNPNIKIILE